MNLTTRCCLLAATLAVAACGSSQTRTDVQSVNDVRKIRHVCIIPNTGLKSPPNLDHHFATALRRHNISSEVVPASNRQRLYQSACRYNLRYSGGGSDEAISKLNVLLRTPDHVVSKVNYVVPDEAAARRYPNVQQQVDGIVERLLGKI